jgi:hypothetical protein
MNNERLFLASEISELEALLAHVPDNHVIERMSLKSRLESVRVALAAMPAQTAQKVRLTFRGKPVFGSLGILADFASNAGGLFSNAFSAVLAELKGIDLQDMGPIPDKDKNQLLLTGTALGSFGFEFELPIEEPSLFPEGEAQKAMERIETLFRLAAHVSNYTSPPVTLQTDAFENLLIISVACLPVFK